MNELKQPDLDKSLESLKAAFSRFNDEVVGGLIEMNRNLSEVDKSLESLKAAFSRFNEMNRNLSEVERSLDNINHGRDGNPKLN